MSVMFPVESKHIAHAKVFIASDAVVNCALSSLFLLVETQSQSRNKAHTDNSPPRNNNLLVRECTSHIPSQMPQPIERMIRKRPCSQELRHKLERHRPRRERSSHRRTLKMPAHDRRNEIREAEDIEAAAGNAASDSV